MARIRRLINEWEPTIYHVMSRSALDGFTLDNIEKDTLVDLIKSFSKLYLVDVLGYCIIGNHRKEKKQTPIRGMDSVYSLKRLVH